jgi:hypothetical protein
LHLSMAICFSPVAATEIPHWWPSFLPAGFAVIGAEFRWTFALGDARPRPLGVGD